MDLKQLRYFISVAEKLSFTDAAKEHFIAQSAISKQISNLEKQIGVQLFIRNKRSVQLTEAGNVLIEEARDVITHYEKAIHKARLVGKGMSGDIKIGFLGHEKSFLPQLMNRLTRNFPEINVELIQYTRDALNSSLKNGDIDIGFTLSLSIEKYPEIYWSRISTVPFHVVVQQEHPLAKLEKVSISEIANEPIIVMNKDISPDGYGHIQELFSKYGYKPKIAKECSQFDTVLVMIEAGIGISILPNTVVHPPSTLCFLELEESIDELDFILAWNKNNKNPLISLVTREVKEFLNRDKWRNDGWARGKCLTNTVD